MGLNPGGRAPLSSPMVSLPWSILTQSPFPSMLYLRGAASVAVPPVIQRWCPGHPHRGLTQEHAVWNSWERASVLWWITGGSGKNLGELPLSHLSLHSGCNQHALYFKTSLSINQHWLSSWLGTVRQQAIIRTNIVQFLSNNLVSQAHNELMSIWCRMQQFQNLYIWCVMVDVDHLEFEGQNAVSS